jgi:hypothetical protein
METEETEFGVRLYTVLDMGGAKNFVAVHNFVMPSLSAFESRSPDGYGVNWHVPIDDTIHWVYRVQFDRTAPIDHEAIKRSRGINPDYRRPRTKTNRYLQDREEMKTQTFAGLGSSFPDQDACVTEGAGPIQDRTQEHLGYNDRCIVAARLMLLRAIKDVQEGLDPPLVVRDPALNRVPGIVAWSKELSGSADWHAICKDSGLAVVG